jgi:hypothetical protein
MNMAERYILYLLSRVLLHVRRTLLAHRSCFHFGVKMVFSIVESPLSKDVIFGISTHEKRLSAAVDSFCPLFPAGFLILIYESFNYI